MAADEPALEAIIRLANGDARCAYNILDLTARVVGVGGTITADAVEEAAQQKVLLYDKSGEEHHNIISALHKSLRNSDVDASLYWLARMLEAGEDPLYVARRLIRFASEDIGLADPSALRCALDAKDAVNFIGLPEGKLALAQCVIQLAAAPKSNSVYAAYAAVRDDVEKSHSDPVPLHLRNAPTSLMKKLNYGRGYQHAHDADGGVADMDGLPESLADRKYYHPKESGQETHIKRQLSEIEQRRKKSRRQRKA